ncbi:hypothetical protein SUGI_1200450 [Cryptomeria japonica]|uniref:ABC transporter G family member 3 n=1 Tax=Cryptomeria japonica TaxID=3369 RepID=UPI002414CE32|nr:ABC transporter G family member 3 [Cryptomeria japonica]GLJ55915.1 hypothetical protein SUGI_1200450 [Cryptomeria japonica]
MEEIYSSPDTQGPSSFSGSKVQRKKHVSASSISSQNDLEKDMTEEDQRRMKTASDYHTKHESALVWRDVTVTISGKRKYSDKVVKGCTGYAVPGTLTVIMGPAKSGKSTLLRALAGILPNTAKVYGEVLVNGRKSEFKYGNYGYIGRKDELIDTLTVREMLYHASLLQLPGFISRAEKAAMVEDAILAMSLQEYSDSRIGSNFHSKGLSNGEIRRISIARELITNPQFIFIDEPLYHLDCVSSLLMMVMLKKLASTGRTVIFTMYHSSTEVFGLFDNICLLANGKMLFFGETLSCLQHFANAGFPCPVMQSPSDHFLRAINTDFDKIISMCKNWQDEHREFSTVKMDTAAAIQTIETTYKASADALAVESMLVKLTEKAGPMIKSKGHANVFECILILTWRSCLNMARDFRYFWLRLMLYMLLMISMGTVFTNIGHTLFSVKARVVAVFFFIAFTSLLSIGGFPSHIKEIKVYSHEKAARHTGLIPFLLGNLLSSIPFLFLISSLCSVVIYFLLGLRSDFSLFMYFVLNFFVCLLINEGMLMILASFSPNVFKGMLTMVFLQIIMMLVAGYFRLRDELPRAVWKYPLSYLVFHTYAIEGLLENEYVGVSFAVGQIGSISGEKALRDSYDISSSRNAKWINLLILVIIALGYRLILFLSLYMGEKCRSWPYRSYRENKCFVN